LRIGAVDSGQCECRQGEEDIRHFVLHYQLYQHLRADMIRAGGRRYGDLSYMLGGRSTLQRPDGSNADGPPERWAPDISVVMSVIRFALKAGRLGARSSSTILTQNSQRFGL
jgi:hypothetical protein